ncbi:hypothetical protein SORBI_3003G157400 [Sorghum bicolor]|uniref:Uncharacterized protein n=1 Tax=Sorghum bicolor TaxID=4558 RepID=A0A1W0VXI7_SORBI|nr:hypothetical protein SORBI_3003G157400 [Sorghum bicolor]
MVCIQYTLFFPPTNKSRSFPFKMAPAFLTTLHPATTSFRFPAGAGGWSRPHWAPLAAPTTLSPAATPAVPRRLLLPVPVAAGIWDLISGGAGGASLAVRRGMQLFRQGDVAGSLAEFDKAIEMDPRQKQCTSSYLLLSFQIFGNGASHYTTYTGLKKVQSSSG